MFSDGYADQFGGEKRKKFLSKNLKNLLLEIHSKDLNIQKQILETTIENWKAFPSDNNQFYEQTDDILVVGIKL
jgi:hypothetical protein